MTSPLIAPAVQKSSGASVNHSLETALTAEIQALVPTHIRVERIQTVGVGQIPQIIYKTPKGRCSTLLSKAHFSKIWQCWLDIRLLKSGKIKAWEILATGLKLHTNQGKFFLPFPEVTAFLSRYNRVAIEPLSVKFNDQGAVVWNPIHQTLSQVNETGCSCADSRYRQTICKHQIAVQVCRIKPV